MDLQERLDLLLPAALTAGRTNVLHQVVRPVPWAEIPLDEPIVIRCALAERELLRRVPLAIAPGELIVGRLDLDAGAPDWTTGPTPPDMYGGGQRAHTALEPRDLLGLGIAGMRRQVAERAAEAGHDPEARGFCRAAAIALDGFSDFARRMRDLADDLAERTHDDRVRREARAAADALSHSPEQPARTFHEALQAIHLLYLAGSITVQALYGPGRIDRVLQPYYDADLAAGRITEDHALQLICCQFILMNHVFNLPQPVMVGGRLPDGSTACSEVTRLCLLADRRVGLVNPSLGLAVDEATPPELLDLAARSLIAGRTKPSLFGERTIVEGLQARGVPFADAVEYIHSTCVEITLCGRSNILVASPYINLVKPIEWMLNEGRSIRGDRAARLAPPPLESYADFDAFLSEYRRHLADEIARGAEEMREVRRRRVEGWAFPLASCFTADSLARGRDMDRGGSRYNWTETSNVGLANLVDSLLVIRRRVFEERTHTLAGIRDLLVADFPDPAARAALCADVPRYGNDQPEADALAGDIVDCIYSEHARHADWLGGPFVPGFFCWIMHRILGDETAASPDGRYAGDVLADAAGAAQGRDRSGPTAAIRSITSWDHRPGLGGIVLNLRISPGSFAGEPGRRRLIDLVHAYFALGGFEVQVNAVDGGVLREAQRNPEQYRDLLVRVAGYSDYFTLLDPKMQAEVIARTEHE